MICIHRINNQCELGNKICRDSNFEEGVDCLDDAFRACTECKCPHTYNYVVGSLTLSHINKYTHNVNISGDLLNLINLGPNCRIGGPGTELKKLLQYIGIVPKGENCGCETNAALMDYWGSEKCRLKIDEIVEWLKKEANNQNWIWHEKIARVLITTSCDLADGLSWADVIIRLPITLLGL